MHWSKPNIREGQLAPMLRLLYYNKANVRTTNKTESRFMYLIFQTHACTHNAVNTIHTKSCANMNCSRTMLPASSLPSWDFPLSAHFHFPFPFHSHRLCIFAVFKYLKSRSASFTLHITTMTCYKQRDSSSSSNCLFQEVGRVWFLKSNN